jgi:hypothetical protein
VGIKMVGWIKRIISSIVNWANEPRYTNHSEKVSTSWGAAISPSPSRPGIGDYMRGLQFTVYSAAGGTIIQMNSYDARTDRTNSSLYIVTDKEDLGEELNLIITRENLTR